MPGPCTIVSCFPSLALLGFRRLSKSVKHLDVDITASCSEAFLDRVTDPQRLPPSIPTNPSWSQEPAVKETPKEEVGEVQYSMIRLYFLSEKIIVGHSGMDGRHYARWFSTISMNN